MDLGRKIREQVERTVAEALKEGRRNIAAAVNVNRDGSHVRVYSADDVTIIQRNGETTIIPHDDDEPSTGSTGA